MKIYLFCALLLMAVSASAQRSDEAKIRALLTEQTKAWNSGNLEEFMQPYWKNDSLQFIGKSGVTRGWQATLNNYKKSYPNAAAMGKLSFDVLSVKRLSAEYFFVTGKWMLQRTAGNLGGHYTLLLRKLYGRWQIVADHSS